MNRHGEVWVFAEEESGRLSDVAIELLGKARELARSFHTTVGAVLLGGRGTEELANRLSAFGADRVYLVEDAKLRHFQTTAYRKVVCDLCLKHEPRIVLFGATAIGNDLAPSVASALERGFVGDCTDLRVGDVEPRENRETRAGVLIHTRPALGGCVVETVVGHGPPPTSPRCAKACSSRLCPTPTDAPSLYARPLSSTTSAFRWESSRRTGEKNRSTCEGRG